MISQRGFRGYRAHTLTAEEAVAMTDTQADLAERARGLLRDLIGYGHTSGFAEDVARVVAALQSEREAEAAKARRAALEECAQIADYSAKFVDIKLHRIKFVSPEQYAADLARDIADGIRRLASPAPQEEA